jgi:hypothetical protein
MSLELIRLSDELLISTSQIMAILLPTEEDKRLVVRMTEAINVIVEEKYKLEVLKLCQTHLVKTAAELKSSWLAGEASPKSPPSADSSLDEASTTKVSLLKSGSKRLITPGQVETEMMKRPTTTVMELSYTSRIDMIIATLNAYQRVVDSLSNDALTQSGDEKSS